MWQKGNAISRPSLTACWLHTIFTLASTVSSPVLPHQPRDSRSPRKADHRHKRQANQRADVIGYGKYGNSSEERKFTPNSLFSWLRAGLTTVHSWCPIFFKRWPHVNTYTFFGFWFFQSVCCFGVAKFSFGGKGASRYSMHAWDSWRNPFHLRLASKGTIPFRVH